MSERVVSRAATYGRVPDSLLFNLAVSAEACRLYAYLTTHDYKRTGKCWPGRELVGEQMGWSVRTVSRYLAELQAAGAIKRYRGGDGQVMMIELLADVVSDMTAASGLAGSDVPRNPSRPAKPEERTSYRTRKNEGADSQEEPNPKDSRMAPDVLDLLLRAGLPGRAPLSDQEATG